MPSFEGDVVIPLLVPPCLCPIPEGEGRERRNQREAGRVTVSGVIFWPQINEARELSPTLSYPLSKGHSIRGVCKHHGFQTHPKESKKGTLSQSCTHFCCKKKPSQLIVLNNSYRLRGASSVSGTVLPSWELNPSCSLLSLVYSQGNWGVKKRHHVFCLQQLGNNQAGSHSLHLELCTAPLG